MSQSVLITGCSEGGIGDALAQEFHSRGLKVFASARNMSKMQHLDAMGIRTVELDVLQESSIQAAVKVVTEATGGSLDFLVNNAGGGYPVAILDTDLAKAKQLFDLNLWSVIAVTKAFAPLLKAAHGTVVNHSSVGSMVSMPFGGIYSASKAALDLVSDAMRVELRVIDVSVVILSTAGVKTRILQNTEALEIPQGSYFAPNKAEIEQLRGNEQPFGSEPDEYAKDVVGKLLKSKKPARIWAGKSVTYVWIMLTFFPSSVIDWYIARMTGMSRYYKYQKSE